MFNLHVRTIASAATLLLASLGAIAPSLAQAPAPAAATKTDGAKDRITLRSGQVIEGRILEETPTQLRVKGKLSGIEAEVSYDKSDILTIERGAVPGEAPKPETKSEAKPDPADKQNGTPDGKRIYRIPLTGEFGEDISQTPLRRAIHDAKKQNAEIIVIELENTWKVRGGGDEEQSKDAENDFDALWRALPIAPVLTEEIDREWTTKPQMVFWVKNAMGGAAFLPFTSPTIYMAPEAKIGGIGRVETLLKQGDLVFKEKQISLRMGTVEGIAVRGGYDPRIIRAMARTEYVLSYKIEGGKPIYIERMPEGPDEILLTDDGKDDRKDTIQQLARGEGNDVLTLTADVALRLNISKGTVDNFQDLAIKMGVGRNYQELKGGERTMSDWREDIAKAKRAIPKLLSEYNDIKPGPNDTPATTRGRRVSKLNEIRSILKKYEEAIVPQKYGWPSIEQIELRIKQIQLEGLGDSKMGGGNGGGGGGGGRGNGGGGG
jgi:hypothetical protein